MVMPDCSLTGAPSRLVVSKREISLGKIGRNPRWRHLGQDILQKKWVGCLGTGLPGPALYFVSFQFSIFVSFTLLFGELSQFHFPVLIFEFPLLVFTSCFLFRLFYLFFGFGFWYWGLSKTLALFLFFETGSSAQLVHSPAWASPALLEGLTRKAS